MSLYKEGQDQFNELLDRYNNILQKWLAQTGSYFHERLIWLGFHRKSTFSPDGRMPLIVDSRHLNWTRKARKGLGLVATQVALLDVIFNMHCAAVPHPKGTDGDSFCC